MLGANDVMPVDAPSGGRIHFEDPAWAMAYAVKAQELTAICREANPRVAIYWVGVPSMADPELATGVRKVNAALQAMCRTAGCRFIDTHAAFSDEADHFARHARDVATGEQVAIRTADGVHLTETGSRLLAGLVLAPIAATENLPATAGVDELLARSRDLTVVPDPVQPACPPAAAKADTGRTHEVRSGETLAIIAKRLGVSQRDIEILNPKAD